MPRSRLQNPRITRNAGDEIDGMVRNLCAYALGEPHPLHRYLDLTHQQVLFDGMADALRKERGKALAALLIAGATAEAKKREAAAAAEVKRSAAAAAAAGRKAVAEAKRQEAAAAAAARREAAAATKASRPGKTRAALPEIPPGTRRVLTADELKALAEVPAQPKKRRRASASAD